jgi:acetyl esterase/lipase
MLQSDTSWPSRLAAKRPHLAAAVEAFVAAARAGGARLEIIEVPDGQHGFDMLDHTDQSRRAVEHALYTVLTAVARPTPPREG